MRAGVRRSAPSSDGGVASAFRTGASLGLKPEPACKSRLYLPFKLRILKEPEKKNQVVLTERRFYLRVW